MQQAVAKGRLPSEAVIKYFEREAAIHQGVARLLVESRFFGSARRSTMLLLLERFETFIRQMNATWRRDKKNKVKEPIQAQMGNAECLLSLPWFNEYQKELLDRIGGKREAAQVTVSNVFKDLAEKGLIVRFELGQGWKDAVSLTPLGYLCAKNLRAI